MPDRDQNEMTPEMRRGIATRAIEQTYAESHFLSLSLARLVSSAARKCDGDMWAVQEALSAMLLRGLVHCNTQGYFYLAKGKT